MYIVEGTIGAGKSTFLKLIHAALSEVTVVYEPLHNWQSSDNEESLLAHFYTHPKRWASTMETLIMMYRVKEHIKEQEGSSGIKLMERSIYSGHYCFTYNSYLQGFLTKIEWDIYLTWFNFLIPTKCAVPKGFIYLKVAPEIAYERIKKRNRSGEETIPLDYLQQLDARHTEFLIDKKNILPELAQVPVLVLDCTKDFEENSEEFLAHKEQVKQFIYDQELKADLLQDQIDPKNLLL